MLLTRTPCQSPLTLPSGLATDQELCQHVATPSTTPYFLLEISMEAGKSRTLGEHLGERVASSDSQEQEPPTLAESAVTEVCLSHD